LADGALGDVEGTADRPQVAVVFGPKLLVDLAKLSLSDVFAHRVSPCGWCIPKDRIGAKLLEVVAVKLLKLRPVIFWCPPFSVPNGAHPKVDLKVYVVAFFWIPV